MLRESCKRALWFADSFNVDLLSVSFKTRATHENLSLNLSGHHDSTSAESTSTAHDDLVRNVLYLLDRFAISNEFYHELTMINPSLPRSYKVKRARERISATVQLIRLPKPYSGCYRSFTDCLRASLLAEVQKEYIYYMYMTTTCKYTDGERQSSITS